MNLRVRHAREMRKSMTCALGGAWSDGTLVRRMYSTGLGLLFCCVPWYLGVGAEYIHVGARVN